MKILIISNMYPSREKPYSGVFVKNQYEYLKEELNQNVEIYAMKRSFTSNLGSIIKYIKFFLLFSSYLFRKYNVLHVHFFSFHVFLAFIYKLLHPKSKVVVTFHGSDTKNVDKMIFKYFLSFIDISIAVGSKQYQYLKTRLNKLRQLCAGVDRRIFYRENSKEKEFDFLFVGSFYYVKGVDILCDAIKILKDNSTKFCFIGRGEYQKQLEQLDELGNITIVNNIFQKELRDFYNKSRFLVLPSRGDSFGLVVTEALYCGTPAIVSNIGGMKQQVRDGYNGFILPENKPEVLASKMQEALNISETEYHELSVNAEDSNQEYSLERVCNKLIDIYEELTYV